MPIESSVARNRPFPGFIELLPKTDRNKSGYSSPPPVGASLRNHVTPATSFSVENRADRPKGLAVTKCRVPEISGFNEDLTDIVGDIRKCLRVDGVDEERVCAGL